MGLDIDHLFSNHLSHRFFIGRPAGRPGGAGGSALGGLVGAAVGLPPAVPGTRPTRFSTTKNRTFQELGKMVI
jgi:hypothetical protein